MSRFYTLLRKIQLGFPTSFLDTMDMKEITTHADDAKAGNGNFEEIENTSLAETPSVNAADNGDPESISLSTIMAVFVSQARLHSLKAILVEKQV